MHAAVAYSAGYDSGGQELCPSPEVGGRIDDEGGSGKFIIGLANMSRGSMPGGQNSSWLDAFLTPCTTYGIQKKDNVYSLTYFY